MTPDNGPADPASEELLSEQGALREVALELEDLVMHFGSVRAVDGVSLSIRKGQVMALVGESGSGKSTVGRCIVRLLEPTSGIVRIGGADVTHLSRRQMHRHSKSVSIVFQDPAGSLDPRMLVGDVVGEPLRLQAGRMSRRDREMRIKAERGGVGPRGAPECGTDGFYFRISIGAIGILSRLRRLCRGSGRGIRHLQA